MACESFAKAGMMADLGKHRINDLPLDDRSNRGPTYQPPARIYFQTEGQKIMAAGWKKAVQLGKFNDSDAEDVRGLDCLEGARRYDKTRAQRLASLPPHARSGMAAATSPSGNTQVANVQRTPQVSAPARSKKVDVPPTPGPSPAAPTARSPIGSTTQTRAIAPVAGPQPKPTRGLGSSRWATEEEDPKPAMRSLQESKQGPVMETQKREAADDKSVTNGNGAYTAGGQVMPREPFPQDQIVEATQALSGLKIADVNTDVAIEVGSQKHIDSLAGKELGTATLGAVRAWLSINKPRGRRFCVLYLTARNEKCVDFEVGVDGEPRKSHGLLEMLSHTNSGAFLDITFRTASNDIVQYSFELETEKELLNFMEGMEDSRELMVEDLSGELSDLKRASAAAILRKQNSKRGSASLTTGLTAVTYSIPGPTRTTIGSGPGTKITGATHGLSSSDTKSETPASKRQRVMYTREELEAMRNGATPPGAQAGAVSEQAARRHSHKKTDSQECVMGVVDEPSSRGGDPDAVEGRTGRYTTCSDDEGASSIVLGQVRQTVTRNKAWLFQNGTGL